MLCAVVRVYEEAGRYKYTSSRQGMGVGVKWSKITCAAFRAEF